MTTIEKLKGLNNGFNSMIAYSEKGGSLDAEYYDGRKRAFQLAQRFLRIWFEDEMKLIDTENEPRNIPAEL